MQYLKITKRNKKIYIHVYSNFISCRVIGVLLTKISRSILSVIASKWNNSKLSFKNLFETKFQTNCVTDVIDRNLILEGSCIIEIPAAVTSIFSHGG
ncbi:hypothetical protein PUN28_005980 [Cardiocondyla obscurior]|uniref:Uncharacterized protein n=1 Tax=Cardiocondyla obscurior TaxID=286306 RepID=A0AAW2G8N6_9HYME